MSPEPHFGEHIPGDITEVVRDIRVSRIQKHLDLGVDGLPSDPADSTPSVENSTLHELDEHRHENAYRLAEGLHNVGYEPYIVWGVTPSFRNKRLHNLGIENLNRMSNRTHFWVELQPDGFDTPIFADVSARIDGHHNTPYVGTDSPVRYQRMADDPSYLRYTPELSADDLNTESGYESLREAHPEQFSQSPWREDPTTLSSLPDTNLDTRHVTEIIETIDTIQTETDLKAAIWFERDAVFEPLSGPQLTALAKELDWDGYDFPQKDEERISQRSTILEEVNNTTLAILGRDGCVYQLGDTIRFETTRSTRAYGSSSPEPVTRENQIDHLSERSLSISRLPTYSNVPRDSPSARPGDTEIELIERSDLSKYRERFTESVDYDIPESVNGWELVETEVREDDPEETLIANGFVTEMKWSNGETTFINAKWRGSYNCWRLSTPVEGLLTDKNVDEYLYEIDLPQQVVKTEDILELAVEAMKSMDPADFESPYDLRDPETTEEPGDLRAGFAPVAFPTQVGDWELEDRSKYSLLYENTNEASAWKDFTVKIDSRGGVKVRNAAEEEIHDQRYIEKYFPNGDPHPKNVNQGEYAWRRREMFEENWFFGFSFLLDTTNQAVNGETVANLNEQAPAGTDLRTFEHELSTDVVQTMDRDNGTLLAY